MGIYFRPSKLPSDPDGVDHYNVSKLLVLPMKLYLYNYEGENDIENIFAWEPDEDQWWITGFNPKTVGKADFKKQVMIGSVDFSGYKDHIVQGETCMKYFILFLTTIVVLSGCVSSCQMTDNLFFSDVTESNLLLDQVIDALEDHDETALKALFASEVQNNKQIDLDDQLKTAMEYFEGEVTSYENIRRVGGESSWREGKLVYCYVSGAVCESIVTSENEYSLSFSATLIDEENKSNEGIWRIWLGKSEEDYMILGVKNG